MFFNRTPEEKAQVQQVLRQVNIGPEALNMLPMGRFSAVARKAMSPESIRMGAQAFEADVAARAMRERQLLIQEAVRRRALAAERLAQEKFRKVWPEGRSEELISNFINKKPFLKRLK